MILAIDPGTTESGWCVFDGQKVVECGVHENEVIRYRLSAWIDQDKRFDRRCESVAIEMIASYGMPCGREVFETCLWIGRFFEVATELGRKPDLVYRKDVKLHLCQSTRAKDPNVRQALIDRFEPLGGGKVPQIGTKSKPGPLYGVSSHVWSALAVAVTFHDTRTKHDALQPS